MTFCWRTTQSSGFTALFCSISSLSLVLTYSFKNWPLFSNVSKYVYNSFYYLYFVLLEACFTSGGFTAPFVVFLKAHLVLYAHFEVIGKTQQNRTILNWAFEFFQIFEGFFRPSQKFVSCVQAAFFVFEVTQRLTSMLYS